MGVGANPYIGDEQELQRKLAREEQERRKDIKETPILARTTLVVSPSALPRPQADLGELATRLQHRFRLRVDRSNYRSPMYANIDDVSLIAELVASDEQINFAGGMLTFDMPNRHTPLLNLAFNNEAIQADVIGSTTESTFVAQQAFSELWASCGVDRSWTDDQLQLVGYMTTTRAQLGVNLEDFFSPEFRQFLQNDVQGGAGFQMGRQPGNSNRGNYGSDPLAICYTETLKMQVSLFDKTTGRSELCQMRFDTLAKSEVHQGVITVTTELDSPSHTKFLGDLRDAITADKR